MPQYGTMIPNLGGTGVPASVPAGQRVLPGTGVGQFGVTNINAFNPGSLFKTMFSGAPNAPIQRAQVQLPNRADFGTPIGAAPNIATPSRSDFGTPDREGIAETAATAREARAGFNNPRGTAAFANLMGLAQEQTGQQEGERQRHAADVAQRRGYGGGYEDEARAAQQDKMQALASAGFEAGNAIRQQEGEQYGRAIGAFSQLMSSYNEAKAAGDVAYAQALTQVHMANAENALKAAGLNMQQQGAYADSLNQARMLQAQLDQAFNNSLIDNNRYIQAQQQMAAQLWATQMSLAEKAREFDIESTFSQQKFATETAFESRKANLAEQSFREQQRQFDLGLSADRGTALRTFNDPRYGAGLTTAERRRNRAGGTFTGLVG